MQAAVKFVPIFGRTCVPALFGHLFVDLLGDLAVRVRQVGLVPLIALDPLGRVALHAWVDLLLRGWGGLVGLPFEVGELVDGLLGLVQGLLRLDRFLTVTSVGGFMR